MEVDKSVANKNITIINAEAQYDSITYQNNVTAYVLKNTVTKQAESYAKAKADLKLDQSADLLDFVFYLNIMGLDKKAGNTQLVVDVDRPRVQLGSMGSVGKGYSFANTGAAIA